MAFSLSDVSRRRSRVLTPEEELLRSIEGKHLRLQAAGLSPEEIPETAEEPGALQTIFRAYNVPGSIIRSGIMELADPRRHEFWKGVWEDQESTSGSALLEALGAEKMEPGWKKGLTNFAVETVTDPFTWVGGGIVRGLTAAAPFTKGVQLTQRGLLQPALTGAARRLSTGEGLRATDSLLNAITQRVPLVREVGKVFGAVDSLEHVPEFERFRREQRALSNRVSRRQLEAADHLRNLLDGIDEREGKLIVDTLEGVYLPEQGKLSEKAERAVEGLRNIFKQIADEETSRGIMRQLRENYFPHVREQSAFPTVGQFKPFSTHDPNAMRREIEGPLRALAAKHNFLYEPGTPTLVRQMRAIRATETYDFLKDVLQQKATDGSPLWAVSREEAYRLAMPEYDQLLAQAQMEGKKALARLTVRREEALEKWLKETNRDVWTVPSKLRPATIDTMGDYEFVMDKAMKAELDRVVKMYTDDESINIFLKWFDGAQSWWKRWVTLRNPGYHMNNFIGNLWNMYLGGMRNPARLFEAWLVLENKPYSLALERAVTIDGVAKDLLDSEDIRKLALDYGVLTGEYFYNSQGIVNRAKEMLGDVAQESRLRRAAGAYDRTMRRFGNAIEDDARMALFLDRLKKGDSPAVAANYVNKYLFDYRHGFSAFEQHVMRRIFPFWAWTRRNLPLQVAELMNQPQTFLGYDRARRGIESMSPEEGERPAWLQEAIRLPIQVGEGQSLYWNPRLPLQDIQRIPGLSGDVGRGLLGNVSPFIRSPIEQVTNYDLFTDDPIERFEGETVSVGLPGLGEIGRLPVRGLVSAKTFRDFGGVLNRAGDTTRLFTRDASPADYLRVARFAIPGVYTLDPERQRLIELYELDRRLSDRIRKLQNETRQLVPTVKEARGERLSPAERRRREALQQRLSQG